MKRIEIIKNRLSQELKNCGISQTQLAKQLNVSQSCVSHYIRGDIVPAIDTLAELCIILDVDSNYILGIDENKNNNTVIKNSFNNNKVNIKI